VPAGERYSIGCILFRRALWNQISDGSRDDEGMLHRHCATHGLRIVCARSVPFVHLAYFMQREENRDVIEALRAVYEPRLGHPFPIAMRQTRLLEIESRLRRLEGAVTARLDAVETRLGQRIARVDAQIADAGRQLAALGDILRQLEHAAAAAKARRQRTVRRRLKRAWRRFMQAPTAQ
jgi:hypothetical protein